MSYDPWPELPYEKFQSTGYLLHRAVQVAGKLKLTTPFEPHWANVALWLTSRGLSTGLIPYKDGCFSVDLDFFSHEILCDATWGAQNQFNLASMSVAKFTETLLGALHGMGIDIAINMKPQEIPNAILLNEDKAERAYDPALTNNWWRILVSTYRVLQRYHARFTGITPPIGLMWGTFDLRDARYIGTTLPDLASKGFITRNAYDSPQVEAGFWSGDPTYPRPAFFSLIFPIPEGVEKTQIVPAKAHWDAAKKIFVLDYDDLRKAKNPGEDLFKFYESCYTSTTLAGWDAKLVGKGVPV